jgi:hypothetical protein
MPEDDVAKPEFVEKQMKSAIQRIRSRFWEQEVKPEDLPPRNQNNDPREKSEAGTSLDTDTR